MSAPVVPSLLMDVHNQRIWLDRDTDAYVTGAPGGHVDPLVMSEAADLAGLFADGLALNGDHVSDCGRYRLVKLTTVGQRVTR